MATKYIYLTGGREVTLDDPTDAYIPEQIKSHWAATFPELSAATWDTKTDDAGVKTVTFAKKVGTKGLDGEVKRLNVSVNGCARCGEDHKDLEFKTFAYEPIPDCEGEVWTHWGMCPNLNEPILLKIVTTGDTEEDEAE